MSFSCFSFIGDMVRFLGPQICEQIVHVKNCERNFIKLKSKAEELDKKKRDIEHEICIGHTKNKRATNECQRWLKKVNEIGDQVEQVLNEFKEVDRICLEIWFFNIHSTWNISQMIVSKIEEIAELINNKPTEFLADELPPVVEPMPIMSINQGTSADRILSNILECIQDMKIYKVGIWGMGGIGKTTVMKNLHNIPKIEGMFDIVIWITFGKDFNIQNIQDQIARRLHVNFFDNESRSRKLLTTLSCKKFMLLMDDVWGEVAFDEIGIPFYHQANGSKVILTTRNFDVCLKKETDIEIHMGPLSEDESWEIFHKKVGDVDFRIQPLAKLIVQECSGLPLALNVIGASLSREKRVQNWQVALYNLRHPEKKKYINDDMEAKVYSNLEFSVNRLESENLKNCFLYTALYPEDYQINIFELIEYWRVEGFLDSTFGLVEARLDGHAFLRRLVESSLLIAWSIDEVKMHDLLRDLAFKIISHQDSRNKFLVGSRGETPSESNQWMGATMISFMPNQPYDFTHATILLDQAINCPSLKTLLIKSYKLKIINPRLFDHMESLRVLDFSRTDIESLPPSIASLVSLVGLYLRECHKLKTLPLEIGSLQRLEVLDLWATYLHVLPMEVSQLTRIRVLQVGLEVEDGVDMDGVMRSGIISKLQKLEQLWMDVKERPIEEDGHASYVTEINKRFKWGSYDLVNGLKWDHYELVNEISSLNRLTSLQFPFRDIECVKHFVETSRCWKAGEINTLRCYMGCSGYLGTKFQSQISFSIERELSVVIVWGDDILGSSSISLFELGLQNLNSLRCCDFRSCDAMEIVFSISNANGVEGEMVLPRLEELTLVDLINLRGIWNGRFPSGSFACLDILQVFDCNNLKHLLSYEICQHLCNLRYIAIESCSALEEVIFVDQFDESCDHHVLLPNLRILGLKILPELVVFLRDGFLTKWPSIELIVAFGCRKLKRLPFGLKNAPRLENLGSNRGWEHELIWSDDAVELGELDDSEMDAAIEGHDSSGAEEEEGGGDADVDGHYLGDREMRWLGDGDDGDGLHGLDGNEDMPKRSPVKTL